ncbi:MAG: type II secretion system F family protein [Gammaproteobacteria bacterium]|nr:type II secretion system F family protein [Gammaproteobacteria bacterium]
MATAAKTQKISTFVWKGTDRKGRTTKGEIKSVNLGNARADLRRQGIRPTKISKQSTLFQPRKKPIKTKDIVYFTRQMATMLKAGVPMVTAFDIVAKGHSNPSMSDLIFSLKASVESGSNFAESLAMHPVRFNELYVNLVRAGEAAGILDDILEKLATYLEKIETLKGKIRSAMFYPMAVLAVAFIVTLILLLFVIPVFEDLFNDFGSELPALTQFVVQLSEFAQKWWWLMIGIIGGAVFGFIYIKKRSPRLNHFLDRAILKMPVIGELIHKATTARFARTLSTMFAAGVPLVEAMESVAGAAGNVVYEQAILKMRDDVATGVSLQQSMEDAELFNNMVVQMVAIGEESGSVDDMLSKVADFYEEEVDALVDSLTSLLEPMIMAFLGVVVGGLVIAMYLPIFKIAAAI